MSISFDFSERVAIVTGAARGVGHVLVGQFVAAGAAVVAVDRDTEGLHQTCARWPETRVVAVVGDISREADVVRIVDTAVERFGRLDVCVNNAAVAPHTALLEERVEVWDRVYAVNCRGTFLMTREAPG